MFQTSKNSKNFNLPKKCYLINSIDMNELIDLLHKENAMVSKPTCVIKTKKENFNKNVEYIEKYEAIFFIDNEKTSNITRSIMEKEILKVIIKPFYSFEQAWKLYPMLQKEILYNNNSNEAIWKYSRKYKYKIATTFMPSYAKAICNHFNAKIVLDLCAGWGDRMLGASVSTNIEKYIGFDPNTNLKSGYIKIMKLLNVELDEKKSTNEKLFFENGYEIYNTTFQKNSYSNIKDNSCDLVFTSPPFFDYEIYNENIPTYKNWIKDFYIPLFVEASRCVTKDGVVAIYLDDTNAGEIQNFLLNEVNKCCNLKFVYKIGFVGVYSKKIRNIWCYKILL